MSYENNGHLAVNQYSEIALFVIAFSPAWSSYGHFSNIVQHNICTYYSARMVNRYGRIWNRWANVIWVTNPTVPSQYYTYYCWQ